MTRGFILTAAALAAALALASSSRLSAHKTAVSPYTFHRDVVPILEARCGQCHHAGSASNLDLFSYDAARAASWRIRQTLVRNHMPPWFAEGPFKAPEAMTARELNILMTWATGGSPEGAVAPHPTTPQTEWALGRPDLVASMPAAYTFTSSQADLIREATLAVKIGARTIRAVDFLPGTRAVVRSAEIIARGKTGDVVLGLWQPGDLPQPLAIDAGFRTPANASLVVRIHYLRHFGDPDSDRSRVGVYFAPAGTSPIATLELAARSGGTTEQRIGKTIKLVAIRPIAGPSGARARLTVVRADGTRQELAVLELQKDWKRRYVIATPVTLPAGTVVDVFVSPSRSQLWTSLTGEGVDPEEDIRLALEFVN
jgi:hypothetical protein